MPARSQIPKISVEGAQLIPSFWPGNCSTSLHQDSTSLGSEIEEARDSHHYLPGRYFDYGTDPGITQVTHGDNSPGIGETGLQVKNHKKCVWKPTQTIEFLGFLIDSVTTMIYLPQDKVEKVKKESRHMINKRQVRGR